RRAPVGLDLGHWNVLSVSSTGLGGGASAPRFPSCLAGLGPPFPWGPATGPVPGANGSGARSRQLCRQAREKSSKSSGPSLLPPAGEGGAKRRMRGDQVARPLRSNSPSPLTLSRRRERGTLGGSAFSQSGFLFGGDHHHHLPPFQARPGLDHDVLAQVGLDPGGHLPAQLLVAHLAATETDVDLDLVAILQ